MEPDKCEKWEWVSWQNLQNWPEMQRQLDDNNREAGEMSHDSSAQLGHRKVFLPLLNLLRQRPGLDPGTKYEMKLSLDTRSS